MARIIAVLRALATVEGRNARSMGSFTANNFFLVALLLLFLGDPQAFVSLTVIIGVVLFLPLSADPLRRVPKDRLAVWPLSGTERRLLRLLSPWFNPVTWLLAALAIWRSVTLGLWVLVAGFFAIGFVAPSLPFGAGHGLWRRVPHIPGPLDQLLRKNLRQALSTLDFYCGLVLSAGALGARLAGQLFPEALLPMTILVMLAISTQPQSLFGLDSEGGMTRYRLLPVRGWQVLAAKDLAFLLTALLLTSPLRPLAGLAAALMLLALGHSTSVNRRREQVRWRFSEGSGFGAGMFRAAATIAAAASAADLGPLILLPCAAACAGSVWWCGRGLERPPRA